METRLIVAYSLIALMAVLACAALFYARRNTRERRIARQRGREDHARAKRIRMMQAQRPSG